jgi:hypothetical protein
MAGTSLMADASLRLWVSGFAELGAEFGNRLFVAGVLVGELLCAVGFLGVDRGVGGGEFGSEADQNLAAHPRLDIHRAGRACRFLIDLD